MALLLHVHGPARPALSPFAGHLVRNLAQARFDPSQVDPEVDVLFVSFADDLEADALVQAVRRTWTGPVVILRATRGPWGGSPGTPFLPGVAVVDGEDDRFDGDPLRRLVDTLDVVLPGQHLADAASVRPETGPPGVIDLRRHIPRGGTRNLLRERLGTRSAAIGASARAFAPGRQPAPAAAAAPAAAKSPRAEPPVPQADAESPKGQRRPRRGAPSALEPLLRALLDQVDRLYGVRETADAVAGHLKDAVGVDAVAVLVPDGTVWAVAGAVGHRHLEERLTLLEDHWLVREVDRAHHGLVIEDTDVVRSRLAGVPLSAWTYLMAAPLPDVGGIVLLARGEDRTPFTARDLGQVTHALTEADGLFTEAVQLRELARRMRAFAELGDGPPFRETGSS